MLRVSGVISRWLSKERNTLSVIRQEAQQIGIPPQKALNVHVQGVNQMGDPVRSAMLAAAALGFMDIAGNRLAAFSEDDRNRAMGVGSGWQVSGRAQRWDGSTSMQQKHCPREI